MAALAAQAAAVVSVALAALAPVAQAHHHGIDRVRFLHYGIEDGLSQATVRTLLQDRAGFIWLGTQDGLNRFDGYEFHIYRARPGEPGAIGDSHVTSLALAGDGSVWCGTQSGGVSRYDSATGTFTVLRRGANDASALAGDSIGAIAVDATDALWIGTTSGQLQWRDREGRFQAVTFAASTRPGPIRVLRTLASGELMVGARGGLWRVSADRQLAQEVPLDPSRAIEIYDVLPQPDGGLLVATATDGLYELGPGDVVRRQWRRQQGLPDDALRALLRDRSGRVWIASGDGLARLDRSDAPLLAWRFDPAMRDGLASGRLHALMEDRDGLIWIGTWLNGVNIFNPRNEAFVTIRPETGDPRSLPAMPVRALDVASDGTLWLGVLEGGGLVNFAIDRGLLARYRHDPADPQSLGQNQIQAMADEPDGTRWIATLSAGLDRFEPGTGRFQHFRHNPRDAGSIASDNLQTLAVDRAGTLWVGTTDSGLDALCAGCSTFRHYSPSPGDPQSIAGVQVVSVRETSQGELWVGMLGGGLARMDRTSGRFESFRPDPKRSDALSHDSVTMIMESRNGELWVGTQGGGVNRMLRHPGGRIAFQHFASAEGLAGQAIGALAEDDEGRIWAATTLGLSRIDPASGAIENFGHREGVQLSGYFIGASARLPTGEIAFGGLGGVTAFDPAQVVPKPPLDTVAITEFRPLGQQAGERMAPAYPVRVAADGTRHVDLDWRLDGFTFEFAALSFASPSDVSYRHQLEGFDDGWVASDARRRSATYTNLPPGDYRFRVSGGYPGTSRSAEAQLAVHLPPPPWRTGLAYVAYLLSALALVALVWWEVRQRLRERAQAQREIAGSEQRLKLALWGSGDEMWDVDLATGALNRSNALTHLQVTHAQVPKTLAGFTPYVHPDDLPAFGRALRAYVDGETDAFDFVYRSRDLDGEWRWLRSRGRAIVRDAGGKVQRIVGTTADITQIKEHEQVLARLNQALEQRVTDRTGDLTAANDNLRRTIEQLSQTQRQLVESEKFAALGGLVAGVAHEINTPLGIGVTAASHLVDETRRLATLLESGAIKRSDLEQYQATARESTEMILRNLRRADKLVKSFKQVAVDQSSEHRRRIELGPYLDEILTSLQPALRKGHHVVEVRCEQALTLDTFPGAIYQILVNLVMNSILHGFEAMERGRITIEARRVLDDIELVYADNGRGMSEDLRRRVFEPFFTTRRGQGGSGLGMHIVYNLATQVLRGGIALHSAPGEGVRITLRFPGTG